MNNPLELLLRRQKAAQGDRMGLFKGGSLRDSGMVSTSKGYGPAGAGGAAMAGADPFLGAAVSLGLPRAVQELYLSGPGRRYLTNQLAANRSRMTPALAAAITTAQGRELGDDMGLLGMGN